MQKIIDVKHVTKAYVDGKRKTGALADVSFSLPQGESMAIIGPSGSGKTTLLHVLGGLEKPTSGEVEVLGKKISDLSEKQLSQFRNQTIGFVFQFFYLHEYLTVRENVALPLLLAGKHRSEAHAKADKLLERIGMTDRAHFYPKQLSGGEMQRVAVARALANDPKLILADEPTGNLDRENAENILNLFDEITQSGVSVVVITHDKYVTERFEHVLKLNKGGMEGKHRRGDSARSKLTEVTK
jgi:ABC-type lipoprotein export system ATPase subunit